MPTVMVIDDSEDFRAYLTALLERQGYTVLALENGAELPRLVRDQPIDAVITDLFMPQVDGLEVVSFFRKLDPHLPVFGVTGSPGVGESVCIKAMNTFGAREVFPKPLDSAKLLAALGREVSAAAQRDERQGVLDLNTPESTRTLTWESV